MIEVVLTFIQYVSLSLATPSIPLPSWFKTLLSYMAWLNLDSRFIMLFYPNYYDDFFIKFVLFVILLPLAVTFMVLIIFNSKKVVFWYFNLVLGCVLVICALLALTLSFTQKTVAGLSDTQILAMAAIGTLEVIISTSAYVCYKRHDKSTSEKKTAAQMLQQMNAVKNMTQEDFLTSKEGKLAHEKRQFVEKFDWSLFGERMLYLLFYGVVGVLFSGILPNPLDLGFYQLKIPSYSILVSLAMFLLFLAVCVLLWILISTFSKGRNFQFSVALFLRNNLMKIAILSLSVLYIPITSLLLTAMSCSYFTCDAGTRFYDKNSMMNVTSLTNISKSTQLCYECNMTYSLNTTGCLRRGDDTCPGETRWLLDADNTIQCTQLMRFFWPATAFMITGFVIGIPNFFWKLTMKGTDMLSTTFPIMNSQDMSDLDRWHKQTMQSDAVSIFLFQDFDLDWRYWRLYSYTQKLIIVAAANIKFKATGWTSDQISATANFVVHIFIAFFEIYAAPYQKRIETVLSIILQWLLALLCLAIAAPMNQWFEFPEYVLLVLLVMIVIVPIFCIGYVFYSTYIYYRDRRKHAKPKDNSTEDEGAANAPPPPKCLYSTTYVPSAYPTATTPPPPPVEEETPIFGAGTTQQTPEEEEMKATSVTDDDFQQQSQAQAHEDPAAASMNEEITMFGMIENDMHYNLDQAGEDLKEMKENLEKEVINALEKMQDEVDGEINRTSLVIVRHFFLFLGVMCFCALGLCVVGILNLRETAVYPLDLDDPKAFESTGGKYDTWNEMVIDCCCISHLNPSTSRVRDVEKWVCANSDFTFEKKRSLYNGSSGLSIRGMCQTNVTNRDGPCGIVQSKTPPRSNVTCQPGNYIPPLW